MLKRSIIPAAILILMTSIYYVMAIHTPPTDGLISSNELHQGMQNILENKASKEVIESPVTDSIPLPDPSDYAQNANPDQVGLDPDFNDPTGDRSRFQALTKETHKDIRRNELREEIQVLRDEIPRDEETIKLLLQKGQQSEALEVRNSLKLKLKRLSEIENNTEENI